MAISSHALSAMTRCHKKPGSCKSFDDSNESPDVGHQTLLLDPPFLGVFCLCKLSLPSRHLFMKNCGAILTTKNALLPIPVGVYNPQGPPFPQRRQPFENIKQHCLPFSTQTFGSTTETHGNVSRLKAERKAHKSSTSHL